MPHIYNNFKETYNIIHLVKNNENICKTLKVKI